MRNTKAKMLLGAALCLLSFTGQSIAQPREARDAAGALDDYYFHPRRPRTFRALTGMGDPVFDDVAPRDDYAKWKTPADKMLLKQLMPSQDISRPYFYPRLGDCRLEGPMMTIKARIATLGADHPYVKQWILTEQAVLARCNPSPATEPAELPPEMTTNDPAIARLQSQDRAYQQAAALFYQDTNAALEAFQKIAQDKSSPDRPLATYMVLAIHAGNKAGYKASSAALPPSEAVAEIHAAMADPSLVQIHAMAAALIGYIGATVADAPARHAQIAEALQALEMPTAKLSADPVARKRYTDAVADMPYIFFDSGASWVDDPGKAGWVLTGEVPDGYTASAALADFAKTDPMAAWIGFPSNPYAYRPWAVAAQTPLPVAVNRYLLAHGGNETTNPWVHANMATPIPFLAALTDEETARLQADPQDAQAAAALSLDFPELVRRDLMEGDKAGEADALRRLQGFPFSSSRTYRETLNHALTYLITNDRLEAARRLRDLLKLDTAGVAEIGDALIILAEDENHLVKAMGSAQFFSRSLLNPLSASELWRLAGRTEFKRGERAMFARSAWSREYALGRTISKEHDRLMRDLNPEITGNWKSPVGHDVTPDDRRILSDLLASPGMNIVIDSFSRMPDGEGRQAFKLTGLDHYDRNDNNWWCGWEAELRMGQRDDILRGSFGIDRYRDKSDLFAAVAQQLQPALRASFIDRMSDRSELAALSRVDCAPKMLGLRVIDWVTHGGWFDSGKNQAEALANVVLATRYGCNRQGSHQAYSQKAFILLHTKFGETEAAKRTRYWFR
jgi:hypothetical protein